MAQVESGSSTNTLYAHAETTTIGGSSYYSHKLSSADGPATTLSQSAASIGRKLMGRWVYPLSGIVSIPASTWTVTYRAMRSAQASSVVAHGDINILIRKSDNTIRTTITTNVANSPSLTLINAWETLTGTYDWPGYTVVDQTDYLEVAYYIEVTTSQSSKSVRLLVDDGTLPLADQTKIEDVMFTYPNQAPVASFTYSPSNPLIYDVITFSASASYDPDGSIVSYKWDFGDGNITTVTNPIITHVYTTAASTVNYTVTLTVTDNEGSACSTTQIVPVTNPSILHVSLLAGTYFGPDLDNWLSQCWRLNITGLSATFTLRINNTHASYASYDTHLIIALNNASYAHLDSLTVDTTTIPKTSFVYGTPKPYGFDKTWEEDVYPTWFSDAYVVGIVNPKSYKDVQVLVAFSNTSGVRMHFDAYGSTESPPPPVGKGHVTDNPHQKDSTVLFSPPYLIPPVACFTVSNDRPNVCETVTFNATCSYDSDGWIVNYTWNFGDSNITTVTYPIITHHYDTFGNYTATLTVTDNDGLTNSASKPIWVREHPVARFTYSPSYPQVCEVVVFNASDSTADGGYIVNYTWDFGDSNITTATDPIITHHYDNYGNYTVTLNVTDSEGKWDTESKNITVRAHPHADFTWSPLSPQIGETVTFDASTSTPNGGTIISYIWDFGDSNSGSGKIVTHTYATFGNYSVTLNVTDSEGKWDVVSKNITVRAHPHADFTWSPAFPEVCEVVTFNASASTPDGGTITSYKWDFGDGNITVIGDDEPVTPIITHHYAASGNYNVTLTVTDSEGKSDSTWKMITVAVVKYYLTVEIDPAGIVTIPGEGWYDNCTYVNLTAPTPVSVSLGVQYRFDYWDVNGVSQGPSVNPISVHLNANLTATAHYVLQYLVTFAQTGLDNTATGTVVTVDGVGKSFVNLPFSKWVDSGSSVSYSYNNIISSTTTGKRFRLVSVTGPTSPVTVTGPVTITGNYKTQYYLTVKTDPAGIAVIPGQGWYDDSTDVTLTAPTVPNYDFLNWDVDGVSQGSGVNPITVHMDRPQTATAHYQPKVVVVPVGGGIVPIDKSRLLAPTMGLTPWMGLALTFLGAVAVVIILIRRGNKLF